MDELAGTPAGEAKRSSTERNSVRGALSYIRGLGCKAKARGWDSRLLRDVSPPLNCVAELAGSPKGGSPMPSSTCPASHAVYARGSQARGRRQPSAPWAHAMRRHHGVTGEEPARTMAW